MKTNWSSIQGEEQEGYYVQPMMKRIWSVQLDILKVIDGICKRHDIKYYGWYGTLLGAVRHQGFIPWDDDMDFAMLRKDYEKFRYYIKTELPEGWSISESQPAMISVFNTDRIRLDREFLEKYHGCPFITGVDIFCLDNIPQNNTDEELHLNLFQMVYIQCLNWEISETDEQWKEHSKWDYLKKIEELSGYHFDIQCSIKNQLYFLGDKIAAMYWDTECDYVSDMAWLYEHRYYRIPLSCFDKTIDMPFEETTIPVLENYDLICKLTYGNEYMIPKKECDHDYLKKQVEYLREYFKNKGEVLPEGFSIVFE